MSFDDVFKERIPRRQFLKRPVKGGVVLVGAPVVASFLSPEEAAAQEKALSEIFNRDDLTSVLREALARGGDFADVYVERVFTTTISYSESKVQSVRYGLDSGAGVRVLKGDQTGYAYCEALTKGALTRAASTAAEIASGPAKQKIAKLSVRSSVNHVPFTVDPLTVSEKEKVRAVETADRAARAVDPRIAQVTIQYQESMQTYIVANSDGVYVADKLPMMWFTIDAVARDGDKRRPGYVRQSARRGFEFFSDNDPAAAGAKAARQAVVMLDSRPAPMGEMPVVLASGGGVMFHEAVGHGLEADGIKNQTSMFTGKLGQRVGSEHVTLLDDATLPNLRGSYNFDGEGTLGQSKVLIERGILKSYMNDLLTAKYLGVAPSGNGRRESYRNYPLVRMSNTYLATGPLEAEEIITATPNGIYAKELGGGEVDTSSGNFTFAVREAYLIQDGKLGAPILGATLIGNGPETMKQIDMVGKDISYWPGTCGKGQWAPVTSGAPTLRIARITVGGRE